MRTPRGRLAAAGAVLLATGALIGSARPAAAADPPPATPGGAGVLPAGHTYTVTLLTGDVVTLRTGTSRCPRVTVRPVRPDRVLSRACGPDGHVHVVPADVAGLIGSTVDPALFDVTTLVQQGDDDARTDELPLIVRYATGRTAAPLTSGLRRQRTLSSIGGVAGRQPKPHPTAGTRTPLTAGGLRASLSGVGHVWLDRTVRSTGLPGPDRDPTGPSVSGTTASAAVPAWDLAQMGAPAAWRAGYTGTGVRVAVLDTGIDPNHPDLAGRVVASQDFTGTGDVTDHVGHGTHVAATVAGTGAASGGVHRGVAPDARLVVGKVLDDNGDGTESSVIAGMQWAAPLAGIVNLSLGGDPSDGTDPISVALDDLAARYGTLFVVAAGNAGPTPGSVSSPAAAASALAVGAVDRHGALADFSSRGPLEGSYAAKPEISAPGVDTVSARAAGTTMGTPIDSWYTRDSGTSMAAPHVAGAAALVRQRHPQWTAGQVEAALVDTAGPVTGGDLFDHGAGQVDVAAALGVPALPDRAVLDLGTRGYPGSGAADTRVTWTNTTDRALTVRLRARATDRSGAPVPAGTLTLSPSVATLAPGTAVSVVVTLDRAALAGRSGGYEGWLTAEVAGGASVREPLAFFVEPASHDLTISAVPLPGTAAGDLFTDVYVVDLDEPVLYAWEFLGSTPTRTVRVPDGRYSVLAVVMDGNPAAPRMMLGGVAQLPVNGDTTVTVDGTRARPVTARVEGVDTRSQQTGVAAIQAGRYGPPWWVEAAAWGADAARDSIYTTPVSSRVDVGYLHLYEVFGLRSSAPGPSPFLYDLFRTMAGGLPADPSYVVGAAERDRLARIDERFDTLDLPGAATAHQRYGESPDGILVAQDISDAVPATRVDHVTPGVPWSDEAFLAGNTQLAGELLDNEPLMSYAAGSRQAKTWFAQPLRPDWYDADAMGCSPQPVRRTRGNLHVELLPLVDGHNRANCMASLWPAAQPVLRLYRDGQPIGTAAGFAADFAVPAEPGTYRLVDEQDDGGLLPFSTSVTTAWTFRSTGPRSDASVPVPLFSLDYALPLDAANHPAGDIATFTVRQAAGTAPQRITALTVWTSTDDGATWTAAAVERAGTDGFTARLPVAAPGRAVSLRVAATGSGGSGIDQTIIRAYRGA